MNRTELIAEVAEKAEISQKDADAAVTAIIDVVTESLRRGEKVQLVGFGTFDIKERAARMAHNPQTKELISVAASKVPVFKAGKALKDTVDR